jgi:hypothetical protein
MKESIIDNLSDLDFQNYVSESTSVYDLAKRMGYKFSPGKNTKIKIRERVSSLKLSFKKKEKKIREKQVDSRFENKNLKAIGDVGEAYFRYQCLKNGIVVSKVDGDNAPYEFVMDVGSKLIRVQVKTTSVYLRGSSIFNTGKPLLRGNKFGKTAYKKNEVDYFYLFSTILEEGYLLPFEEIGDTHTTIRKEEALNKQSINVKKHEDWLFENVISKINP